MKVLSGIDMGEVTRLTKAGRLSEAMAILRGTAPTVTSEDEESRKRRSAGVAGRADRSGGSVNPPSLPPASDILPSPLVRTVLGRVESLGVGQPHRAPVPAPVGARFEERRYANAAGMRTYKLYVPSGYAGQPLPFVVMLHGCTQSPDDFAAGTGMNVLAEEQLFLVAYPAQSQSANASKCWNWFNAGDQLRDAGEPSLIAGITREVMREFAIDPRQVYVAGPVGRGAAAAIMAAAYPELYAGVGVHSGLACGAATNMSSAFTAMKGGGRAPRASSDIARRPVPTIVFHGDRDTTVHPVNGDQVVAQSTPATRLETIVTRGEAPSGMRYTRTIRNDDSGYPVSEHWVLHGAGHAWAGGSPEGSYTDPRGPDASREMMRFFAASTRTAA